MKQRRNETKIKGNNVLRQHKYSITKHVMDLINKQNDQGTYREH